MFQKQHFFFCKHLLVFHCDVFELNLISNSYPFLFFRVLTTQNRVSGTSALSVVVIAVYVNRHYWKYAIFNCGNPGIITTPFVVYIVEKEKYECSQYVLNYLLSEAVTSTPEILPIFQS